MSGLLWGGSKGSFQPVQGNSGAGGISASMRCRIIRSMAVGQRSFHGFRISSVFRHLAASVLRLPIGKNRNATAYAMPPIAAMLEA